MPRLRELSPGIELLLVGSYMPPDVFALAASDVKTIGFVPTLDSIFKRVRLTVAPLRYGAGVKGKVLDSLAAGVPCVMTSVAAEGLELSPALGFLVADEPAEIANRIAELCGDDAVYRRMVNEGLDYIRARYSSERIDELLRAACGAAKMAPQSTPALTGEQAITAL